MKRVRILCYRKDLFRVCRLGFMADNIGPLWCQGWVPEQRVALLRQEGIWFESGERWV